MPPGGVCGGRGASIGADGGVQVVESTTPPPLVQATGDDQKGAEPAPSVAWTRALRACHTAHGARDAVFDSETQGAQYATQAIKPKAASLTQNMSITHPKAKASDRTHCAPWDKLENAPQKISRNP